MLTKEYISEIKSQGNRAMKALISSIKDEKSTLFILENLGCLPSDFDDGWIKELLVSDNNKIRLNAIKNIGKIKNHANLEVLFQIAINDKSTSIRREATSSIGRMRSKKAMDSLLDLLNDNDPKIISQAIRGLLVFKGDEEIDEKLKKLANHENEMIQSVIKKEYFSFKNTSRDKLKHPKSYDYLKNTVVLGDVRDILKEIPDESFHLTFTSPPYYNARDYSIYTSYKAYLKFLEEVFKLTYDKTKEGRFLIVNTSPVIVPRISRQYSSKRYPIPFDMHNFLIEIDWEFIDDIIWVKPEASVKNRNAGFLQHRKPLAYKPNARTEYLMVYRKQTDKLIDWNIKQYDWETVKESKVKDGYETSNVWEIDPTFNKVHSAVFPVDLCKRVIEYYSFKGDLVFDPFGGSGTFGRTAKYLDRYFFLTEQESKYFEYMKSFAKKGDSNLFKERESVFLELNQFKKEIK
ncbi:DNA methyltransferase [Candidatus Spongiihabitans sp.]|uniref:DNA methyltransferase n=1 Tax=Candidatus Spongiihabitans sp. TaxID=3101308 RepID=UPI003C7C794A